jgi:hypothetical protein
MAGSPFKREAILQEAHLRGTDFSEEEIEFMNAMERYKRLHNRPFPHWHEVLTVLYSLGYRKSTGVPPCSDG